MKMILMDGEYLCEGDSLEAIAAMGVDLARLSFAPQDPAEVEAELVARMTAAVQRWMDGVAQQRHYDGILSLCTYATSTDSRFRAEGQAGVEWRDRCWALGYRIIEEVRRGARPVPTEEDVVAMMPPMQWPPAEGEQPLE
ncbi:hypothetical protein [Pseudomonas sp. RIT-PI-AD]|uniref:hypothetical protein n=1 Tax=Pseudomonas sp. RIT-PI-AD TaxID=3035294 RepID=UPI0021D8414F|nr:hypothetical protein [Pseudomonas sp. RIT-PI-AD]